MLEIYKVQVNNGSPDLFVDCCRRGLDSFFMHVFVVVTFSMAVVSMMMVLFITTMVVVTLVIRTWCVLRCLGIILREPQRLVQSRSFGSCLSRRTTRRIAVDLRRSRVEARLVHRYIKRTTTIDGKQGMLVAMDLSQF